MLKLQATDVLRRLTGNARPVLCGTATASLTHSHLYPQSIRRAPKSSDKPLATANSVVFIVPHLLCSTNTKYVIRCGSSTVTKINILSNRVFHVIKCNPDTRAESVSAVVDVPNHIARTGECGGYDKTTVFLLTCRPVTGSN